MSNHSATTQGRPTQDAGPVSFSAQDRCDRCGAQAYVRIEFSGKPLLFCAHHDREHRQAAVAKGGSVTADSSHVLV